MKEEFRKVKTNHIDEKNEELLIKEGIGKNK
jgi:hypothetical protein